MKQLCKILLTMILIQVATGCSLDKNQPIESVDFDKASKKMKYDIIDGIEVIPLEFKEGHYPDGISNLIVADSLLIFRDYRNVIYVYSDKGDFISDSANHMGKGNGEYSILTAFSYNKFSREIEVATPLNLLFYDLEFKFLRSVKLPTQMPDKNGNTLFVGEIYDISPSQHLLLPTSTSENNRQIMMFDSATTEVVNHYDFSEGVLTDICMQDRSFYEMNDGNLYFFPPGTLKYIYRFDKNEGSFKKSRKLSFGHNEITASEISKFDSDKDGLKALFLTSEKTIPLRSLICGNTMIFITKSGKSFRKFHTVLYNTDTDTIITIDNYESEGNTFPLIEYADNQYLYGVAESENLQSSLSGFPQENIIYSNKQISDGTLAILKYKLHNPI